MDRQERRNLSMLFDFYEMTMSGGYFRLGMQDRVTYFDVFFRRVPDGGGFAIAAGLGEEVPDPAHLHPGRERGELRRPAGGHDRGAAGRIRVQRAGRVFGPEGYSGLCVEGQKEIEYAAPGATAGCLRPGLRVW